MSAGAVSVSRRVVSGALALAAVLLIGLNLRELRGTSILFARRWAAEGVRDPSVARDTARQADVALLALRRVLAPGDRVWVPHLYPIPQTWSEWAFATAVAYRLFPIQCFWQADVDGRSMDYILWAQDHNTSGNWKKALAGGGLNPADVEAVQRGPEHMLFKVRDPDPGPRLVVNAARMCTPSAWRAVLGLVLASGTAFVTGWLLLCAAAPRVLQRRGAVPLALVTGWLAVTWALFLLGWAGVPYRLAFLLPPLSLAWLLCGFRIGRSRAGRASGIPRPRGERIFPAPPLGERLIRAVCLGVLLGALAAVVFAAVSQPVVETAVTRVWGMKSKVFYTMGRLPLGYWRDGWGAFSHPDYPLAFALALTWIHLWGGGFSELAMRLALVPFTIAALWLAYALLRDRRVGRPWAWGAVTLLATCGTVARLSYHAYAGAMLLATAAAGVLLLQRAFSAARPAAATSALGWTLLAATAWVKQEGAIIFTVTYAAWLVSEFLRQRHNGVVPGARWARALLPLLPFALVLGLWRIFLLRNGAGPSDFGLYKLTWATAWGRVGLALRWSIQVLEFDRAQTISIWCAAVAAVLLAGRRLLRHPWPRTLLLAAPLMVVAYLLSFAFSQVGVLWQMYASFWRLILVPGFLLVLLLAEIGSRLWGGGTRPRQDAVLTSEVGS